MNHLRLFAMWVGGGGCCFLVGVLTWGATATLDLRMGIVDREESRIIREEREERSFTFLLLQRLTSSTVQKINFLRKYEEKKI